MPTNTVPTNTVPTNTIKQNPRFQDPNLRWQPSNLQKATCINQQLSKPLSPITKYSTNGPNQYGQDNKESIQHPRSTIITHIQTTFTNTSLNSQYQTSTIISNHSTGIITNLTRITNLQLPTVSNKIGTTTVFRKVNYNANPTKWPSQHFGEQTPSTFLQTATRPRLPTQVKCYQPQCNQQAVPGKNNQPLQNKQLRSASTYLDRVKP